MIDANALIAEMHNVILEDGEDRRTFYEVIERQPTIEERKTGAWIREEKHYKDSEQEYYYYEEHCSVCGARRKIGWAEANYCPNCGCFMKEGNDER